MPRIARRIRHRIELAGVRLLVALPRVLPLKISIKLGGALGILAFDVFRIRRRVVLENLDRAFGDTLAAGEKARIGRSSYVNFAKSIIEFASLGRLRKEDYPRIVRFEGLEHLKDPIARGHGVIAVTGHFGSWELLGAGVASRGLPVDFLVGEQANSLVNDLMNDLRRSAGIGIIERGVAARGVFEALKKGRIVALLADQDARKAGVFVDFFGTPASTFQGPAQFACRTGSPLVGCAIVRRQDETHDAILFPPIYPNAGADREAEVIRLTREHTKILEDCVRRYPEQYFWAHRRWKTKPPLNP
ncbi:MAG: lysophospholipid acyltransferase family protein [Candidatus Krumholzibacteria bacterium]|nr:lysophospholipid acyltransferase family protein [Candidatus Krumholzibacteria bacterium]